MRDGKRVATVIGLALAITATNSAAAGAQGTLYYNHSPNGGSADQRLAATPDFAKPQPPAPGRLRLPKGGQACIRLVNDNPLLYKYSLDTVTVSTSDPAGLKDFLGQLGALAALFNPEGGAPARPAVTAPPVERFRAAVASLVLSLAAMENQILASDKAADREAFEATLAQVTGIYGSAKEASRQADESFKQVYPAGIDLGAKSKDTTAALDHALRLAQQSVWQTAGAWNTRVGAARKAVGKALCAPVGSTLLKISLNIQPNFAPLEGGPARPVKDSVQASFQAQPYSTDRIVVSPGGLVTAFVQDQREVGLLDGGLTVTDANDVFFHPALFLHARTVSQVFLSIGVADSEGSAPSFFLGLSLRGGEEIIGTEVSLGAGLSLGQVTTGIKEEFRGRPLPAETPIESVADREYRPGLGVIFSISGLKLGK
jgi:hypothetical protein